MNVFNNSDLFVCITKGVVEERIDEYNVRVRLPIFNKSSNAPQSTPTNELYVATSCIVPNCNPNYQIGDVVYVTFEDNDIGKPVILGMLHSKKSSNTFPSIRAASIDAKYQSNLPKNTTIGDITSQQVGFLQNLRDNVQVQLDLNPGSSQPQIVLPNAMTEYFGITYNNQKPGATIYVEFYSKDSPNNVCQGTDVNASITNTSAPGLENDYKYTFVYSNYGYWTFTKTYIKKKIILNDAIAYGATVPVEDELPVLSQLYPYSNNYTVNYSENSWFSENGDEYSDKFSANSIYYIEVTFTAKDGYMFNSDSGVLIPYMGDTQGQILSFLSDDTILKCRFSYVAKEIPKPIPEYTSFYNHTLSNNEEEPQYKFSTYFNNISGTYPKYFMIVKDKVTINDAEVTRVMFSNNLDATKLQQIDLTGINTDDWQYGTYGFSITSNGTGVITYSTDTKISAVCGKAPDAQYTQSDLLSSQYYDIWKAVKKYGNDSSVAPYSTEFSDFAVASIIGNMSRESGMMSYRISVGEKYSAEQLGFTVKQDIDDEKSYTSGGYGLCQWTGVDKQRILNNYIKSQSSIASMGNYDLQCKYLISNLKPRNSSMAELLYSSLDNTSIGAGRFYQQYEAPGVYLNYRTARRAYFGGSSSQPPKQNLDTLGAIIGNSVVYKDAIQNSISPGVNAYNRFAEPTENAPSTVQFTITYTNGTTSVSKSYNCAKSGSDYENITIPSSIIDGVNFTKDGMSLVGWDVVNNGIEWLGDNDAESINWAMPLYHPGNTFRVSKNQPNITLFAIYKYHIGYIKYQKSDGTLITNQLLLHENALSDTVRNIIQRKMPNGTINNNYSYDNTIQQYDSVDVTWRDASGNTYHSGDRVAYTLNSDGITISQTKLSGNKYYILGTPYLTLTLVE